MEPATAHSLRCGDGDGTTQKMELTATGTLPLERAAKLVIARLVIAEPLAVAAVAGIAKANI